MPATSKSKKSKSRPAANTAISHPIVEDSSIQTVLSCFSPSSKYLAYVSLAVDKHRLRIYDAVAGQSVAEYTPLSARVSALSWGQVGIHTRDASPSRKKRRKSVQQSTDELVLLGLSDGSIVLISPKHGRALHALSHPSCSAPILAIASTADTLWTSCADGNIYLWNIQAHELIDTWKTDDRIPYTSLALHPTDTSILAAHHSIRLLQAVSDSDPQNPNELALFTGHVSSIKQLRWDSSKPRFFSMAEGDRIISLWEVPDSGREGRMVASIQLDSDVRSISLGDGSSEQQALLALTASGKVSICPIPSELIPPASARTQHKVSTLLPCSVILQKGGNAAQLIAASFIPNRDGAVRIARVVAGIRPVFDDIQYLDDTGQYIPNIVMEPAKDSIVSDAKLAVPNKRYSEPSSVVVGSGVQLGQHENMDDTMERAVDGDLDVNIAELSLGQRLAAVSGEEPHLNDSDEGDAAPAGRKRDSKSIPVAATGSLTQTLIQALHSSDSKLLETCLAHSNQSLIKNTIRRLPPQLTMPLIIACVERLGRGARGANLKGGGAGASSQRGATLIAWIRTTLTVHSGHLMTMPDLVARLSGLHATLTTRIALQESLLSLSGRLDMVLSQIEMRSSTAPASVTLKKGKPASGMTSTVVGRYVEGQSEEETLNEVEVEMEDEDAASVEDVEFAGDGSDESGAFEEEEEDSDDEDEDDNEMNGFIDDEAEEYSEEEEEEESE